MNRMFQEMNGMFQHPHQGSPASPFLPPRVSLPGPALPLNLPTVLITVQQKKSELRKDQSVELLNHWGFTFGSSSLRSCFLPSITQEREGQSEGEVPPFKAGPA